MQIIFRWFYCLPILYIAGLLFVGTAFYLILRRKCCHISQWYGITVFLFCIWITVVLLGTIIDRTAYNEGMKPIIIPFYSYYVVLTGGEKELLRENLMNIILFYPAGLFACELLPKSWSRAKRVILVAVLLALVSVGIEFCQYHFALGQAEVDDVIHNTLGALIGALVCTINLKWKPYKSKD